MTSKACACGGCRVSILQSSLGRNIFKYIHKP